MLYRTITHSIPMAALAAVSLMALPVVAGAQAEPVTKDAPRDHQTHAGHAPAERNVVHITAEDYAFRAPAEIPSGWTTFELENAGEETHMLFIARLPAGVTFDNYMTGAVMPFNEVWQELRAGELTAEEVFPAIGERADPWFWDTAFEGGVGFLSPGQTASATMNLRPGNYVIECYMRTPEGEMHSMEGMIDPLTVTAAGAEGAPPRGDVRLTLSEAGIQIDQEIRPGTHTFEVHFADHPEGTFGHNVHVLRADPTVTTHDAAAWMSFVNVAGLTDPAPGTFVGGLHLMPVGSTGYFTADLRPGRYLFVSEYTGHMGVAQEVNIGQ
jgi:hypothetical protein